MQYHQIDEYNHARLPLPTCRYTNVTDIKYPIRFHPYLCQHITKSPSYEGGEGLGSQRRFIQSLVVCVPSRNGSSTNEGRVTEKRAANSGILAKGGLDNRICLEMSGLGDRRIRGDSKGTDGQGGRDKEETEELHGVGVVTAEMCGDAVAAAMKLLLVMMYRSNEKMYAKQRNLPTTRD
jgi:hypothetical protein